MELDGITFQSGGMKDLRLLPVTTLPTNISEGTLVNHNGEWKRFTGVTGTWDRAIVPAAFANAFTTIGLDGSTSVEKGFESVVDAEFNTYMVVDTVSVGTYYLYKFDKDHNIVWQFDLRNDPAYPDTNGDTGSIIVDGTDLYVLAQGAGATYQTVLLKLNTVTGALIEQRAYVNTRKTKGMTQDANNIYFMTYTDGYGGHGVISISKVDFSVNWVKRIDSGDNTNSKPWAARNITYYDGNLYILIYLKGNGSFAYKAGVVKLSSVDGSMVWMQTIYSTQTSVNGLNTVGHYCDLHGIAIDSTGVYVSGYMHGRTQNEEMGIVVKLNFEGIKQWYRVVDGNGAPSPTGYNGATYHALALTDTHIYAAGGNTKTNPYYYQQPILTKFLKSTGDIIYHRTLDNIVTSKEGIFNSIHVDGNNIGLTGYQQLTGAGTKALLVSINDDGVSLTPTPLVNHPDYRFIADSYYSSSNYFYIKWRTWTQSNAFVTAKTSLMSSVTQFTPVASTNTPTKSIF